MISNNNEVNVIKIKNYYITNSFSRKHNEYFDGCTMPLEYFFKWRYEAGFTAYIPFKANLTDGGQYD